MKKAFLVVFAVLMLATAANASSGAKKLEIKKGSNGFLQVFQGKTQISHYEPSLIGFNQYDAGDVKTKSKCGVISVKVFDGKNAVFVTRDFSMNGNAFEITIHYFNHFTEESRKIASFDVLKNQKSIIHTENDYVEIKGATQIQGASRRVEYDSVIRVYLEKSANADRKLSIDKDFGKAYKHAKGKTVGSAYDTIIMMRKSSVVKSQDGAGAKIGEKSKTHSVYLIHSGSARMPASGIMHTDGKVVDAPR